MTTPARVSILGVIVVPSGFALDEPLLGLSLLLRHALVMQAAGANAIAVRGLGERRAADVLAPDARLRIPVGDAIVDHEVALVVRADVTTHRVVPTRVLASVGAVTAAAAATATVTVTAAATEGAPFTVRAGDSDAGYYACSSDRTAAVAAELERTHDVPTDRTMALLGGISPEFVVRLGTPEERRTATWKHLVSLRKPTSGYFERLYMRPMSMFLTWPLASTRVTPNAMSLVTFALGLGAAIMVGVPDTRWNVAGAVMHMFMRVVDCVDGELARLRYQGSSFGAWLDSICDGISMAAFVGAVGYRLDGLGSPYAGVGYFGAFAWMGVQLLEWRGAYLADTGGSVQTIAWGYRTGEPSWFERMLARLELLMRIDAISTYYGIAILFGAFEPLVVAHSVMCLAAIGYYATQLRRLGRSART